LFFVAAALAERAFAVYAAGVGSFAAVCYGCMAERCVLRDGFVTQSQHCRIEIAAETAHNVTGHVAFFRHRPARLPGMPFGAKTLSGKTMTTQSILIVEDEKDIREVLAFNLKREGFSVLEAGDGRRALELAKEKKPDLILLDLMLPVLDGLSVSRSLQHDPATAAVPIIMITAKGEEVDRIVGLELGAADYVTKPFSVREVILRIRSVLRRRAVPGETVPLCCGDIRLDAADHAVWVAGVPVGLTVTEFRLLEDLLRNKGKVRSRAQLLDAVWGFSFEGYARTVDTHIRRLRSKLGDSAERIETVRGIGYRAGEDGDKAGLGSERPGKGYGEYGPPAGYGDADRLAFEQPERGSEGYVSSVESGEASGDPKL
jgi:two-component system phosphate regulon response regulator PhoB